MKSLEKLQSLERKKDKSRTLIKVLKSRNLDYDALVFNLFAAILMDESSEYAIKESLWERA